MSIISGNMPMCLRKLGAWPHGLRSHGLQFSRHPASSCLAIRPIGIWPHGLILSGRTASWYLATRHHSIWAHSFSASGHTALLHLAARLYCICPHGFTTSGHTTTRHSVSGHTSYGIWPPVLRYLPTRPHFPCGVTVNEHRTSQALIVSGHRTLR